MGKKSLNKDHPARFKIKSVHHTFLTMGLLLNITVLFGSAYELLDNRIYGSSMFSMNYSGSNSGATAALNDSLKKERSFFIITGNTGIQLGRLVYNDTATGDLIKRFRCAATLTTTIKVYKYLELSATGFYYFRNNDSPPLPIWLSDMYYSLKWANWEPYKFSFGYENYADNRFNEPFSKWKEKFFQGLLFVSYNANLPSSTLDKIRIDNSTNFVFVPAIRYLPTYRNQLDEILDNKIIMSLTSRYTIGYNIYLEGGVHYYPLKDSKMPWDPDFTYGFGYFDYRPWKLSITYGNWIANRFDFKKELPEYGFLDGNFSINFNYKF